MGGKRKKVRSAPKSERGSLTSTPNLAAGGETAAGEVAKGRGDAAMGESTKSDRGKRSEIVKSPGHTDPALEDGHPAQGQGVTYSVTADAESDQGTTSYMLADHREPSIGDHGQVEPTRASPIEYVDWPGAPFDESNAGDWHDAASSSSSRRPAATERPRRPPQNGTRSGVVTSAGQFGMEPTDYWSSSLLRENLNDVRESQCLHGESSTAGYAAEIALGGARPKTNLSEYRVNYEHPEEAFFKQPRTQVRFGNEIYERSRQFDDRVCLGSAGTVAAMSDDWANLRIKQRSDEKDEFGSLSGEDRKYNEYKRPENIACLGVGADAAKFKGRQYYENRPHSPNWLERGSNYEPRPLRGREAQVSWKKDEISEKNECCDLEKITRQGEQYRCGQNLNDVACQGTGTAEAAMSMRYVDNTALKMVSRERERENESYQWVPKKIEAESEKLKQSLFERPELRRINVGDHYRNHLGTGAEIDRTRACWSRQENDDEISDLKKVIVDMKRKLEGLESYRGRRREEDPTSKGLKEVKKEASLYSSDATVSSLEREKRRERSRIQRLSTNRSHRSSISPVKHNRNLASNRRCQTKVDSFSSSSRSSSSDEGESQRDARKVDRLKGSVKDLSHEREKGIRIKLEKYDGRTPVAAFLAKFEVCARCNRWSGQEKADQLMCALTGPAAQLLWDMGDLQNVSWKELVCQLKARYGSQDQTSMYRLKLKTYRQASGETLNSVMLETRRLMALAYPGPSNDLLETVACDAFIDALGDQELAQKVREKEPSNLESAYKHAVRFDAYGKASNQGHTCERRLGRVKLTKENFSKGESLDHRFQHIEQEMKEILAKIEQLNPERSEKFSASGTDFGGRYERKQKTEFVPRNPSNRNFNRPTEIVCFGCGISGHIRRNCPKSIEKLDQDRFWRANTKVQNLDVSKTEEAAQSRLVKGSRMSYVWGKLEGNKRVQCLLDSGSEMSLVPKDLVPKTLLRPAQQSLIAANGTRIKVEGEANLKLRIGRKVYDLPCLVTDQVAELILGLSWLERNHANWKFGAKVIRIGNKDVPLHEMSTEEGVCRRIEAEKKIAIPSSRKADVLPHSRNRSSTVTVAKEISKNVFVNRIPEKRQEMMQNSYRIVREQLLKTAERRKKSYDLRVKPQQFMEGDWVYYYYPRVHTGRKAKWTKFFTGPFFIVSALSPVLYRIQKSPRSTPIVVHVDKLKAFHGNPPRNWVTHPDDESMSSERITPAAIAEPIHSSDDEPDDEHATDPATISDLVDIRRRRITRSPRWLDNFVRETIAF